MKKRLLNNFAWIFVAFVLQAQGAFAKSQAYFLILRDGISISDESDRLELAGARIRQRVPPTILIADLPDSVPPDSLSIVKSFYASAVPVGDLEPMGPLAVAAGLQWNRTLLSDAKSGGAQTMSRMRTLVAQRSLKSPQNLQATAAKHAVTVKWNPLPGAFSYEVEASLDSAFGKKARGTRTLKPEAVLAAVEGTDTKTLYVRVRGIDHGSGVHKASEDVAGGWSNPISVSVQSTGADESLPAPTLSSPLADIETTGTTLILEWIGNDAQKSRVSVARDAKFNDVLFDEVVSGRDFVCPSSALHIGDTLFWRVRAWDDAKSPWSDVRKVTIGEPHHAMNDTFINPEAPK